MVRIGCSDWSYEHWRGVLYPDSGSIARWLALRGVARHGRGQVRASTASPSATAATGGMRSRSRGAAGRAAFDRRTGVYAYFNNDWEGFAIANARALRKLVEEADDSHARGGGNRKG